MSFYQLHESKQETRTDKLTGFPVCFFIQHTIRAKGGVQFDIIVLGELIIQAMSF